MLRLKYLLHNIHRVCTPDRENLRVSNSSNINFQTLLTEIKKYGSHISQGARGSVVVVALYYKTEGRGFESR
jgi:hypothetical protein